MDARLAGMGARECEAMSIIGGDRPHKKRRQKRNLTEADVGLFLRQHSRNAHPGHDPNDRHYNRQVEKKIKRMKAEDLERLIRGDDGK